MNEVTRSQKTRPIQACFPFSGGGEDMGGYEEEHPKPGHLDRVFWVVEVGYAWGKVNELTRSQKTRPEWTCFETSGGGGK